MPSENDPQVLGLGSAKSTEGEERFVAGANLFWFEEGIRAEAMEDEVERFQ